GHLSTRAGVRRVPGSIYRRLDQSILRLASRVPGGRIAGPCCRALVSLDREGTGAWQIRAAEGRHTPAIGTRDAAVHDRPEMLRAASFGLLPYDFHSIRVWNLDGAISRQDPASKFCSNRHVSRHREGRG